MSYDLMVFEPSVAPADHREFMEWYRAQTEWTEAHGYADPQVCSVSLRDWFFAMKARFPAMNGPYASDDVDDAHVTDYSFGRSVIYCAFAWSVAEEAYEAVLKAAQDHRVGFFDVSGPDAEVWMERTGEYKVIYKASAP